MLVARRGVVRLLAAAAVVMLVAPGASAAGPPPAAGRGNPVTTWNRIATNTLVQFPAAAGGAPPALQVHMGMVQGAVYDAVNATTAAHYRPYLLKRRFAATASKEAAVATAAYRVLSSIVSTVPLSIPFPNRASLLRALDAEYEAALDAVPGGPFKRQGIAAGRAAADAMIAARRGDGRFGPSPWVPNEDPGHWQPLQNADGTQQLDPTPWVGGVRPFVIKSASQFRTAGPQALTGAAWAAEFNEVKSLGSLNSAVRSAEQTHIALWWQSAGGPTLLWNGVARDLADDAGNGVDILGSALLLAKLNLGGADAAISCWNDKYHRDFWRPWQAIHQAASDGNPATEPDPSWAPLLTAPYPEHPSGHLCLDGAHLGVLRTFFGTDEIGFHVTSSRFGGETRHFERFSDPLEEIIDARIWAGLHFRTADVQAANLGGAVVEYMEEHHFKPLH